jgi:hypothetical protein
MKIILLIYKKYGAKLWTEFLWLRRGYNENTVWVFGLYIKPGNFRLNTIKDRFWCRMWKVKVSNYETECHTYFVSLAANHHHYVQYASKGEYGTRRKKRNMCQNYKERNRPTEIQSF